MRPSHVIPTSLQLIESLGTPYIHNWLRTLWNPHILRLEQGEYPVKHRVIGSDLFHDATDKGEEHFTAQPVRALQNAKLVLNKIDQYNHP